MRFRATDSNLVINLDTIEAPKVVAAIVGFFVPRFAKKIYFLSDQQATWSRSISGLSRVTENQEPSNFTDSVRIIQRGQELVVVAASDSQVSRDQWRSLAKELAAGAA